MTCYVLELKSVHGNRVVNEGGLAKVYYTNATHDTLTYAAPGDGKYINAVAVEADNIQEAMKLALAMINETSGE